MFWTNYLYLLIKKNIYNIPWLTLEDSLLTNLQIRKQHNTYIDSPPHTNNTQHTFPFIIKYNSKIIIKIVIFLLIDGAMSHVSTHEKSSKGEAFIFGETMPFEGNMKLYQGLLGFDVPIITSMIQLITIHFMNETILTRNETL